ncbi:GntR family transcriptional regulator [Jannaschia sp. KMU-145]|uniref:GntR family transcriptional regulator n=1 Tax=Jannaschia halovivens TaxID=3388667 RepID=UPI00396B222C
MDALDPVTAEPALTQLVHDRLVEAISAGRLPPGARLTQDRVAKLLDVSRQPVSHALQLLRHQGLAVQHGRKGLAVAPMDGVQIWRLYQVRAALDGLAARLAATRVRDGVASRSETAALRRALERGAAIGDDAKTITLVRADVAFHRALHDLSGNAEIARTVSEQWPQFMRSMAVVLDGRAHRTLVWTEHAAIVAPVLAGDADAAERCARDHAERAGEETKRRLGTMAAGASD